MQTTTEQQQSQLTTTQLGAVPNSPIVYGIGSFGLESLYQVFSGFYVFYYVDHLGLAVSMMAIVNLIYGFWDAVDDPVFGFLSDNTRTRWGRRRPWLMAGLPFYVSILILVYAVPGAFLHGNALFWYALVIFTLFEAAYTIMSVNYTALFPELFQGIRERARASSISQGFSMLGQLVGFSIPPFIYAAYGFIPMAISFAVIAGIALLLGIVRIQEDPGAMKVPPLDLKNAFGEVLKDRPFVRFAIAVTFLMFTTGVYTLATPFWVKYTLGAGSQATSFIFAAVFITAILSVFIWGRLVQAFGIRRTWLLSVGIGAAAAIVFGLASNLALGMIGAAAVGAGMGGIQVCRAIIMANFVDRSLKHTGHRREGIYYSLLRVMGKLSKVLEAMALVLLGLLFGYVSGENPGPQPENAFRFLMAIIPLICIVIAWLIASRLSFENEPE